ncbi:MAG: tetratricopeptide repeat protein [Saccharothrix sp.]|nr:tetratricopeptide repeat protein [Saccharothrix sp.]
MVTSNQVDTSVSLPDPGVARTLTDLTGCLRSLKLWAGNPSYEVITSRINAAWKKAGLPPGELARRGTVVDCFKPGRRRINSDLVVAVVRALHPDTGYVAQWRQALRVVVGETDAAAQVRVRDGLPWDPAGFLGRIPELDRIRERLGRSGTASPPAAVCVIEGMAGVGKTRLAVHAGHLLDRENRFDRVLFVDLRGFHHDPAQPPADPTAVLDGFLRLLGMTGQRVPHDLDARVAAYRTRLAGTRTLVVLDNASSADQVRPLLPNTADCPALVTSRRKLTSLRSATHLAIGVFTPQESLRFLTRATARTPIGPDPDAATRIARHCGNLPLALELTTAHIRALPDWTLTDHADRLDELRRDRRVDTGVELALELSYRRLPTDRQRLLRLLALHPGQDFDVHSAAALTDTHPTAVQDHLDRLRDDHLLHQDTPGRYSYHDLVRAYATSLAVDKERPPDRRAALRRLFDHYLTTATVAMDHLFPARVHRHPAQAPPTDAAAVLTGPDDARRWLEAERPTLVAIARHTADHGLPTHTTRLSTTLFRYLSCDHPDEALAIHHHALDAARHADDPDGQAHALIGLGGAHAQLGHLEVATDCFQQALLLFRQTGDLVGQARAHTNLGATEARAGHYRAAADLCEAALALARRADDRTVEINTLNNLGQVERRLGRHHAAITHIREALTLSRRTSNRDAEATALNHLGDVETRLNRHASAHTHLHQALAHYRRLGSLDGEVGALHNLGNLQRRLGHPVPAADHYQQALAIARRIGNRYAEAVILNSLGEAANAARQPEDALAHHTAALTIADDIHAHDTLAQAHTALGHLHRARANPTRARRHYQHAIAEYTRLGLPEAHDIRAHLTATEDPMTTASTRPPS